MKEPIIDGLFYGGLEAFGRRTVFNEEVKSVNMEIERERSYFLEKMSEDDRERFYGLENLYTRSSLLGERDGFSYGLRLGIMLMCEISRPSESTTPTED